VRSIPLPEERPQLRARELGEPAGPDDEQPGEGADGTGVVVDPSLLGRLAGVTLIAELLSP